MTQYSNPLLLHSITYPRRYKGRAPVHPDKFVKLQLSKFQIAGWLHRTST